MHKSNGTIHGGLLVPSHADYIALCSAVEDKFKILCNLHMDIKGVNVEIPHGIYKDMVNWRTMASRYKKGDFRHTNAEKQSLKTVAQWTLAAHAKLRNQPTPKMEWRDYD